MCKQVSRLGFILLGRLPAGFLQWHFRPFVGFTVTGVARNFHPHSLGGIFTAGALLRRYTRYSFNHIIECGMVTVNTNQCEFNIYQRIMSGSPSTAL